MLTLLTLNNSLDFAELLKQFDKRVVKKKETLFGPFFFFWCLQLKEAEFQSEFCCRIAK